MLSLAQERNAGVEAFEYGPKMCFGRFFADAGLYLNIVRSEHSAVISCFQYKITLSIRKGEKLKSTLDLSQGILTCPDEFKCRISEKHADLIRHE